MFFKFQRVQNQLRNVKKQIWGPYHRHFKLGEAKVSTFYQVLQVLIDTQGTWNLA